MKKIVTTNILKIFSALIQYKTGVCVLILYRKII